MRRLQHSQVALTVIAILMVAGLFRAWLIADHRLAFESDEAVVGLMARHINTDEAVPTFFYGQSYMGSLDALLVAGGFRLAGNSVHSIRLVQLGLFLVILMAGFALAWEVTRSRRVAAMTLLLLAIPTPLGALYTGITLGGYNELVLFGALVLLLGWQVTIGGRRELWRWAALGLVAGLGWWTNSAIVTPCLVVGLLGLRTFSARQWLGYALAAVGFLIGGAPWWVYNLRHDWAALHFLTGGFETAPGVTPISPGEAALGLLVLGIPALYGLRFPWEAGFSITIGTALGGLILLLLFTDLLASASARRRGESPTSDPAAFGWARRWVWLTTCVFAVVFIASPFSDATGRYLMPVWIPVTIGLALGLDRLRRAGRMIPALALAILLVMQAGQVIRAAHTGTGLTPQLVERLRAPATDDNALIAFLKDENYTAGYASYWTAFRVIFRAHDAIILDTALPAEDRGLIASDNRYPPYRAEVEAAPRVVWITQNFPELDALIVARLDAAGIGYQTQAIGLYRVYYAFSTRVSPPELGFVPGRTLEEIELAGWP